MSSVILAVLRLLATTSLLVFVGWALFVLWKDLRLHTEMLSLRKSPRLSLTIQTDDSAPRTQHFSHTEITIGRAPDCACPLQDEATSAQHALLSFQRGQWWLEDLQSTNGISLNGQPVTIPTVVISGDEFRCGNTTLSLNITSEQKNPSWLTR